MPKARRPGRPSMRRDAKTTVDKKLCTRNLGLKCLRDQGLSVAEIADATGWARSTVYDGLKSVQ